MSSFSIVNGKTTSSQTVVFATRVSKEGKYDIGPFVFNIGGKTFKTDSVSIEVIKGDEIKEATNSNKDQNEALDNAQYVNDFQGYSTSGSNLNYMIRVYLSKKEAYVNEYIDVEVKFFAREELQYVNYEPLKFPSQAWSDNFEIKNNYIGKTRINDLLYQEYLIEKKRFYISKEGEYSIEPALFNFNGFIGKGFFSYPERMSLSTKAERIIIKSPPPTSEKDFYGLVGKFTYDSSLSPLSVKEKEAATLTITLSGNGNMQNLKDVNYTIEPNGVEVYSSKSNVKENGSSKIKTWDIILVGQKAGDYVIRLADFTFFNPESGNYESIKGKDYTLKVLENENSKDNTSVVIHSNSKDNVKENVADINYIKLSVGNKKRVIDYNISLIIIILCYAVAFLIAAIFLLVRYANFNLYKNSSVIKVKNAYKNFITSIEKAKKTIDKNFDDKIIDSISNVTETYFIDRFSIDSVEFTKTNIKEKLSKYLNDIQISNLTNIFSNIDFMRFGGTAINKENILEIIKNIVTLIKNIEEANK